MKLVHFALVLLLAGAVPALAESSSIGGDAQVPAAPAGEAPPPPPPLVLLLDGLGVYVENDYIGVSALARPLAQQGFRTRTDSHLMVKTKGIVPDIVIGHSMGGETALRYAGKLARAGYPAPLVITVDAAPAPPACTVPRCVNIAGPGFVKVRGAQNISAWAAGARFTNHAQLPMHPAVQKLILQETASWLAARQAALQRTAKKNEKSPQAATPQPAPAASPPSSRSQMWTVPGWSVPNWSLPGATP